MSNTLKTLSPDEQSHISTYLGFARDEAVIASWMSQQSDPCRIYHNLRMVEYLKEVAAFLGLELVERHSAPAVDQVSRLPIDQKSNEPTAADIVAADFPNGVVNR